MMLKKKKTGSTPNKPRISRFTCSALKQTCSLCHNLSSSRRLILTWTLPQKKLLIGPHPPHTSVTKWLNGIPLFKSKASIITPKVKQLGFVLLASKLHLNLYKDHGHPSAPMALSSSCRDWINTDLLVQGPSNAAAFPHAAVPLRTLTCQTLKSKHIEIMELYTTDFRDRGQIDEYTNVWICCFLTDSIFKQNQFSFNFWNKNTNLDNNYLLQISARVWVSASEIWMWAPRHFARTLSRAENHEPVHANHFGQEFPWGEHRLQLTIAWSGDNKKTQISFCIAWYLCILCVYDMYKHIYIYIFHIMEHVWVNLNLWGSHLLIKTGPLKSEFSGKLFSGKSYGKSGSMAVA